MTPFKPRTLAEVDAEQPSAPTGTDGKSAQLREIIGELQMLSKNGEMPPMGRWDMEKPQHLPKSLAILQRHDKTWNQLAAYARLEPNLRVGSKAQNKHEPIAI